MILDRNNLSNVRVEPVAGQLTDHYDPRAKMVRLSESNFRGSSVAAVSVAAHECGHAIQDGVGYLPMKLRAGLFPVVAFSSQIWLPLFLIGIVVGAPLFVQLAAILFAGVLAFHLVTLPVEIDASRRALWVPHPLRHPLAHRGRRHQAGAHGGCLHLHRGRADRVFDAPVPALIEPERVVELGRKRRKE